MGDTRLDELIQNLVDAAELSGASSAGLMPNVRAIRAVQDATFALRDHVRRLAKVECICVVPMSECPIHGDLATFGIVKGE